MIEEHTFLFADLVGYTALTEAHGDERAADLVAGFFDEVRALLPAYGADEVKSLGDALMLVASDPARAVRLAVRIVGDLGARRGFPRIHAGMHTGPAVARGADWFGATVNIAARVADLAGEGELLVTAATRSAVMTRSPEIEFHARGMHELRNVRERIELFEVVVRSENFARGYPIDPVCRMAVDTSPATERSVFGGDEFFFCSSACREAFEEDPGHYARRRRG